MDSELTTVAAVYGYQGTMYAEWLVDPDGTSRPRLENWDEDDLVAYCGGKYVEKEN